MRPAVPLGNALFALLAGILPLPGGEVVTHPFRGVTLITRTETVPRAETMHIALVDLAAPGIRFKLTPHGGVRETIRQTTLDFLRQEHAQLAINCHFFLPFPSTDRNADLIGLAASDGDVYSGFETPAQSYAIVADAPALNLDPANHPAIVHRDPRRPDGRHVLENVRLWNAVSGSARIVTHGIKTIPLYRDAAHPRALLTPGGPGSYSNAHSWYRVAQARTVIAVSRGGGVLVLFTVDKAGGSKGMTLAEIAGLLIRAYDVSDALNLDGGGSTSMALADPLTKVARLVNTSSDNPRGRAVGSNLAVFAVPAR